MKYRIYRLPIAHPAKFMGTDFTMRHDGIPSKEEYVLVYVGEINETYETHILDKIFEKLNIDHPDDYRVPSLSVSDVIMLFNGNEIDCWYVDSFGFKKIWRE